MKYVDSNGISYGAKQIEDQVRGLFDAGIKDGYITWLSNSNLNKSAQLAVQKMIQSGNYNARIYNNVSEAKRQAKYQAYVRRGYTLLNKIGESIRGKEIAIS